MSELLLEIRCSGYPAASLPEATRRLEQELVRRLKSADLGPSQSAVAHTPRRIMILLRGLPEQPRGDDAQHAYFQRLCSALEDAAGRVEWPQVIRWTNSAQGWVRPVTGVLALLDGMVIPAEICGVPASDSTVGHPTLSPRRFTVRHGDHYGQALAELGIEMRPSERRKRLEVELHSAAESVGGTPVANQPLLERSVCRCEVPGVVVGELPPGVLRLPRVLVTACLNQWLQAFAVESDGQLLPQFAAIIDRPDDPQGRVRAGYEMAAKAHFDNLRFHFARDQEVSLSERARKLAEGSEVRLGRLVDTALIQNLCEAFCEELGWRNEAELASEAAGLLYADDDCELVTCFPELRGVIGGLLARVEGYPESVWQAIYDYGVATTSAHTPRGRVGRVVALAERVVALVCQVGAAADAGLAREQDWRRAATDVIRLLLDGDLDLDFDLAAARAVRLVQRGRAADPLLGPVRRALERGVQEVLGRRGFGVDEIDAVLSADGGRRLPALVERLVSLRALRKDGQLGPIVQTARRLVDILHESPEAALDVGLLVADAEKDLYILFQRLRRPLEGAIGSGRHRDWLGMMASLNGAVERFFREVLVRDEVERVRQNRLALLQLIQRLYGSQVRLAELSLQ